MLHLLTLALTAWMKPKTELPEHPGTPSVKGHRQLGMPSPAFEDLLYHSRSMDRHRRQIRPQGSRTARMPLPPPRPMPRGASHRREGPHRWPMQAQTLAPLKTQTNPKMTTQGLLMPQTTSRSTTHQLDGGLTRPTSLRMRLWMQHARSSSISSGDSFARNSQTSAVDQRLPEWARSGGAYLGPHGLTSRVFQHSACMASTSESGHNMNSAPPIHTTRDGALTKKGPSRRACIAIGRPRSYCNKQFQILSVLHPNNPSVARDPQRRKHRRDTGRAWQRSRLWSWFWDTACSPPGRGAAPGPPITCAHEAPIPNTLDTLKHHLLRLLPKPQLDKDLNALSCRNHTRATTNCRSGPKSGGRRYHHSIYKIVLLQATVGARVSSGVATEEGPGLGPAPLPGKRSDTAPPGGGTPIIRPIGRTMQAKRAYKRACRRAMTSAQNGTMYRGRWHSRQALTNMHDSRQAPPRAKQVPDHRGRNTGRPVPKVSVFNWNVGGLASHIFQELMAWLATHGTWDIIILQETHWGNTEDFNSGEWSCIHSSGHAAQDGPDKHAGVMILLSRKAFRNIAAQEHVPGRLLHARALHVQSQHTVDVISTYQHVHRTHMSPSKNRKTRQRVWHALQQLLDSLPARNKLIIGGDFNSTLRAAYPGIGPATPNPELHNNLDATLQQLIQDQELCALNTWHARPHHTFFSTSGRSQIDYILTKCSDAGATAKQSAPLPDFPVTGDRLANHLPVQATLQLRPFWHASPDRKAPPAFDRHVLQQALEQCLPQAQQLLQAVSTRISALQAPASMHHMHQEVNDILLQETVRLFPTQHRDDRRISADLGYRASASRTWALYRQLKAPGLLTLSSIWSRWRAHAQFQKASRDLRQQSRQLKVAYHQDQLRQAEEAAAAGNHRELFQITKRLGPRKARIASRLKDSSGNIMTEQAELASVLKYGKETFAAIPDNTPQLPILEDLAFGHDEIYQEFARLKPNKAVPEHCAPNIVWQHCAEAVIQPLGHALNRHFKAGSDAILQEDMRDAHIKWLPKPNKAPTSVGSLRPIGLMPPFPKIMAGLLASRIQLHIAPILDHLPQYAYTPGRSCADAIHRVHQHFEAVEQLIRSNSSNRFAKRQGLAPSRCVGGACLSLDLSKAFDCVDRNHLTTALLEQGIAPNIVAAVQQLHKNACYHYEIRSLHGTTTTTNGIKQGCRVAPALWLCYSISVLQGLARHRDLSWLHRIITLFADDWCGTWLIANRRDFIQALSDLELLLEILTIFKLQVNYQKTALLLTLHGKDAEQLLNQHSISKEGQLFLKIRVLGREQHLCIKDSHIYLGTVIAYKNRLDLNVSHRLAAAQTKYQLIRRILNGKGPLSARHKLRLWNACINPSLCYAIEVVGCTAAGAKRLTVMATRHIRAILRQPAHLTHITNVEIWQAAGLKPPPQVIQERLANLILNRDPGSQPTGANIVANRDVINSLSSLQASLCTTFATTAQQTAEEESVDTVTCPHCQARLLNTHALSIHLSLHHQDIDKPETQKYPFSPARHSIAGMPTCRLCLRNFTKWRQLKLHIERQSCPLLGGRSHKLSPLQPDNAALRHLHGNQSQAPTDSGAEPAAPKEPRVLPDELPLVLRPGFIDNLSNWEKLLSCPDTKALLSSHCALCHMWIADTKHIRQHYNKVHHASHPHILPAALEVSKSFKSQLTRGRACRWCRSTVGAPGRHSTQCAVLNQLTVAVEYCKQGLQHPHNDHGGPRGEYLRPLHALGAHSSNSRNDGSASDRPPHQSSPSLPHFQKTSRPGLGTPTATATATSLPSPAVPAQPGVGASDRPLVSSSPEARRGPTPPTERHGIRPFLQAGRQKPGAQPNGSGERVAGTGCNCHSGPSPSLSPSYGADQLPPQGTSSEDPAGDGDRSGPYGPSKNGMARHPRTLELPQVEPTAAPPGAERGQITRDTRHHGQNHHGAASQHVGRRHSPVQVQTAHVGHRGGGPLASSLRSRDLPQEHDGGRSPYELRSPGRKRGHQPGGNDDEKGRQAAPASSPAACTTGVSRPAIPSKPRADTNKVTLHRFFPKPHKHHAIPPHVQVRDHSRSRSPPSHPVSQHRFTLHNPHNHCYLNSFVYCIAALENHLQRHILPAVFRTTSSAPLSALTELGFFLLGWRRPHQQRSGAS